MDEIMKKPKNEELVNLTQSSIRDLEFEVAEMRSTYSAKIEKLQSSIVEENIQALKDYYLKESTTPAQTVSDDNDFQSFTYDLPKERFESIPSEIQKLQLLIEKSKKLEQILDARMK